MAYVLPVHEYQTIEAPPVRQEQRTDTMAENLDVYQNRWAGA
ncbi:hypothetical protein VTL71DRAFT_2044 [Oculimacula yallundae]|uniref:Uncharacterized protein n=1 Tax=Oculimacula yallundae TaxID=86028 RepID=A0ABR4C7R2_9HELO